MLVAGLLLSSSTVLPSNTNILKENAEGGVSSRGMSPLNPRRVIRFDESCCNEEPVDDHFVDESEEDEELESKEERAKTILRRKMVGSFVQHGGRINSRSGYVFRFINNYFWCVHR